MCIYIYLSLAQQQWNNIYYSVLIQKDKHETLVSRTLLPPSPYAVTDLPLP